MTLFDAIFLTALALVTLVLAIVFSILGVRKDINENRETRKKNEPSVRVSEQHQVVPRTVSGPEQAEIDVDTALRGLNERRYFVFKDLIIPTQYKNLTLTQIDHVVVSHRGIFCIETKSSRGSIYGGVRHKDWIQYLHEKNYKLNSPYKQNMHHVRALEVLLKNSLRAPVHSYIVFPNAHKVVVDGRLIDMTPNGVVGKINNHTQNIYDDASVERIAKILAHAGTYRHQLRGRHEEEVRAYVEAQAAKTLRYS